MAASAPYRAGDVIFKAEPWVYSVTAQFADSFCYRCLISKSDGKVNLRRCMGCSFAYYCSEDCQKKDWSERHKFECRVVGLAVREILPLSPEPFNEFLFICKIMNKLKKGELTGDPGACCPPTRRTYNDLLSHEDNYRDEPYANAMYWSMKKLIGLLDKERKICPDMNSFARIYGKFNINSFSVTDFYDEGIAKALYFGPSMFDHSCDPNAAQQFDGKTILIKALKNIPRIEDVRITYIETFVPTLVRRKKLLVNYFFTCKCHFCSDVALDAARHALKCVNEDCDAEIPSDSRALEPCVKCGTVNADQLKIGKKFLDEHPSFNNFIQKLDDYGEAVMKPEERLMQLQELIFAGEKILHPNNFLFGIFCHQAANVLAELGRKTEAIPVLAKALPPMRRHLNKNMVEYTGAVADMADWLSKNGQHEEALGFLDELVKILRVIPGENTTVFKDYTNLMSQTKMSLSKNPDP